MIIFAKTPKTRVELNNAFIVEKLIDMDLSLAMIAYIFA